MYDAYTQNIIGFTFYSFRYSYIYLEVVGPINDSSIDDVHGTRCRIISRPKM